MSVVLIVEDDNVISNQIERAVISIEREIKILKTDSEKQALEISNSIDVDVFIIDIKLPDGNGITLARKIRKSYPFQPIIIESSEGDMHHRAKVHDQIENLAFLEKPLNIELLIMKIKHALNISDGLATKHIKINQNGVIRIISINEVLYIEKVKGERKIKVITYNKHANIIKREEFTNITLSLLLKTLDKKTSLLQCHKAFLVNPKMINKLNFAESTVSLKYTDDIVPIGKVYRKNIGLIL